MRPANRRLRAGIERSRAAPRDATAGDRGRGDARNRTTARIPSRRPPRGARPVRDAASALRAINAAISSRTPRGHLGQEGDDTVLSPREPRLEMKMPLQDGVRQQLGGGGQVRCSQHLLDRKGRRPGGNVRGAALRATRAASGSERRRSGGRPSPPRRSRRSSWRSRPFPRGAPQPRRRSDPCVPPALGVVFRSCRLGWSSRLSQGQLN